MFVLSVVLVIVGAVFLALGVFGIGDDPLLFVYISIASCLLAAVFLGVGVLRGRPRRKPVPTDAEGTEASWAGASAWPSPAEQPAETSSARAHVQVVTADESAEEAEAGEPEEAALDELFKPEEEVTEEEPEVEDEELVIVPKRTAKKAAAKKTTAKKAAAKKAAAKKTTAKKAAAKKATAKKAAAKKVTAKKVTAKKVTARKVSAPAGRDVKAALETVTGIGPAKRKEILDHFGSGERLRQASVADLTAVKGVSERLAKRIQDAVR